MTKGTIVPAVTSAVADARGVDSCSLRPPLYEVIEPEAIEALCLHSRRRPFPSVGSVTFEWCGCSVEVRFSGDVSVTPLNPSEDVQ